MRFWFQTNGEHCTQSSYVIKTEGQLPVLVHLNFKPTKQVLFIHFFHPNWKWVFNFFRFRFQTKVEHCNQSSYVLKTEGQLRVLVHLNFKPTKKYLFIYLFTSFIQIENESSISLDLDFKPMVNIVINHLTSSKPKANYQCKFMCVNSMKTKHIKAISSWTTYIF